MDRDVDLAQLSLEQGGVEAVASQPAGGIDDHRIKATHVAAAGLGGQRSPARPVLFGPGLLVLEGRRNLTAELGDLALAGL